MIRDDVGFNLESLNSLVMKPCFFFFSGDGQLGGLIKYELARWSDDNSRWEFKIIFVVLRQLNDSIITFFLFALELFWSWRRFLRMVTVRMLKTLSRSNFHRHALRDLISYLTIATRELVITEMSWSYAMRLLLHFIHRMQHQLWSVSDEVVVMEGLSCARTQWLLDFMMWLLRRKPSKWNRWFIAGVVRELRLVREGDLILLARG